MSRYNDLQNGRKKPNQNKPKGSKLYNFIVWNDYFLSLLVVFSVGFVMTQNVPIKNQISQKINNDINITKHKWSSNQIKNLLIVQDAAHYVHHPSPKRMGAHLLTESSAKTVLDGDIGNGAFKKSYGILQVKLNTVYYVKNKRPDLINLYVPEVNLLPKEDILDKLRKDSFFNAKIASLMHIVLTDICGDSNKASVAYNRGVCKADKYGVTYLNHILTYEQKL